VAVKTLEDIRLALFEVTADKAKTQLIVSSFDAMVMYLRDEGFHITHPDAIDPAIGDDLDWFRSELTACRARIRELEARLADDVRQ
jgi:hypothetical protein